MQRGIEMIFTNMTNAIKQAILVSGYSRAAIELQKLTDEQLAVAGLSRNLLAHGYAAYPWRDEDTQAIPDNISQFDATNNATVSVNPNPIMPQTTKAA